jgi:hypothetical protein
MESMALRGMIHDETVFILQYT